MYVSIHEGKTMSLQFLQCTNLSAYFYSQQNNICCLFAHNWDILELAEVSLTGE